MPRVAFGHINGHTLGRHGLQGLVLPHAGYIDFMSCMRALKNA
jgi:hypothetical protein